MDKNQGFYDPYNFNVPQNNMNYQVGNTQNVTPDFQMGIENVANPSMYYEQHFLFPFENQA